MKMDSLHCAFPHSRLGLDGADPVTPPATPTQDMARTPTFASCLEAQYAQHEFAQTEFTEPQYSGSDSAYSSVDSQYSSSEPFSRKDSDSAYSTDSQCSRKDSDSTYSTDSQYSRNDSDSTYSSTQSLSLPESPVTTPANTPAHTPYTTRSPQALDPTSPRNRKDSFVYDVRLTDEQFLFFVPDLDLVKSHLMFAVREEVEVLKEKITELMERISQLEYENMVLRQYATQEALQQIQQPHHSSNT